MSGTLTCASDQMGFWEKGFEGVVGGLYKKRHFPVQTNTCSKFTYLFHYDAIFSNHLVLFAGLQRID